MTFISVPALLWEKGCPGEGFLYCFLQHFAPTGSQTPGKKHAKPIEGCPFPKNMFSFVTFPVSVYVTAFVKELLVLFHVPWFRSRFAQAGF